MELFIKQKVFSIGQKLDVFDINGNVIYRVKGQVFSLGKKVRIYDADDNEVVFIKQQLFRFMPRYDIFVNGDYRTTLIKNFTLFKHNFHYDNLDWQIDGDFFAHNYCIKANGDIVMQISKRWLSWGDAYDININESYDFLIALASCIVIDCVCHEDTHST